MKTALRVLLTLSKLTLSMRKRALKIFLNLIKKLLISKYKTALSDSYLNNHIISR